MAQKKKAPILAKTTGKQAAPKAATAKAVVATQKPAASAKPAAKAKPVLVKAKAPAPVATVKQGRKASAPVKIELKTAQPATLKKSAPPLLKPAVAAAAAKSVAPALARAVPAAVQKAVGQKLTAPVTAPVQTPKAIAEKTAAARQLLAAQKKPVNQRHGFKANEFIVYPAHGVGRIIGIEEQ